MAARKTKSFTVNGEKKILTIYDNIPQSDRESADIDLYLRSGYIIKHATKTTVSDMRKELKKDEEALAEFERLYKTDYRQSLRFFTEWRKNHSKK